MEKKVKSKMWRQKQIGHVGKEMFLMKEALRVKSLRLKKKQGKIKNLTCPKRKKSPTRYKITAPNKKTVKSKNFIKISAAKIKPTPMPNLVEEAGDMEDTSVPLSLQDDIYTGKDGAVFKEGDISQRHLVFKHPFTCLIAGPTSSGKTVFTTRLIDSRQEMIEPDVDEIIWCYGIESPQLAKLKERFPGVLKLHKGLPDIDKLGAMDSKVNRLLVLDDLMNEIKGNTVANLFSKGAHHMNISVVYIIQNVFNQNKEMRNVFLNAQYKVLFNNPSDVTQLTVLNSRMFPGHPKFLKSVMSDASKKKSHAYVVLDLHPRTPDDLRVRTEIFPGEDNNVYLPES